MKRRIRIKVVWLWIFLLLLMPLFVSCGGDGSGGNTPSSPAPSPTPSPAPSPVCVYSICFANTPACGQITYGTDNCGNSCSRTGDPCPPTPPPPPPPPTISISIKYPTDNSLIGGGTGITTVEGSVSSCSYGGKIELLVDNALVASADCKTSFSVDFNASKLATGVHALSARILNNTSASVAVKVDPVELRKQALQFLVNYNTPGGAVRVGRWKNLPIVLEISKEIVDDGYLAYYKEATDFWTKYTGITFQIVASAEISVNPMTGKYGVVFCEYGTPFRGAAADTWIGVDSGFAHIASIVTFLKLYANNVSLIAHETGHALGIWAEVNDGTVTDNSHYPVPMRMNPATAEALRILYFELYPGAPVPIS